MSKDFDFLKQEAEDGMEGKNNGLPMGFSRLNRYIGIRKRIYSLIFGATGSGKTSFAHSAYILNPYDYYISKHNNSGVKFKVFLFSMERNKVYTIAKWVSRKIFLEHGILIQVPKMLGWWEQKMSKDEHDLFLMYEDYINGMTEDVVTIIEGAQNPTGFYKVVKAYALENGKEEQISEFKKIYIPNHSNELVVVMADHMGLTKREGDIRTKKDAIDKASEYFQYFRDFYGYSPVPISQLNRDLSNPAYQKLDSFEPNIDQVKETGRLGEDADVVMSLFDPIRFNTTDPLYDVKRFVNPSTGAKHFRSVKVLKNTYGEDDIRIGTAFHGATGIFKELPKKSEMEGFDYTSVLDGSYFLP